MAQQTIIGCECGEAGGDSPCTWHGPRAQTVVVEWMPEWCRASHAAAGNSGSYPHNGAVRLRCVRACAERVVADSDGWATIVHEW